MNKFFKSRSFSFWFVCGLLFFTFLTFFNVLRARVYYTSEISTTAGGYTQLFYDRGNGFVDIDSAISPIDSTGTGQKVCFKLPLAEIRAFRLVLGDGSHSEGYLIKNINFEDENGDIVRRFSVAEALSGLNARLTVNSDGSVLAVPIDKDEKTMVEITNLKRVSISGLMSGRTIISIIALKNFSLFLVFLFLLLLHYEKIPNSSKANKFIRDFVKHPFIWIPFIFIHVFSKVTLLQDRWFVELNIARNILRGNGMVLGITDPPAVWRPLLPSLLLAVVELFVENPIIVYKISVALCYVALFCCIFYLIKRHFGVLYAHIISALIVSIPMFAQLPFMRTALGNIMILPLLALGLLTTIVSIERKSLVYFFLCGVVWGLASITRPEGIIYFCIICLFFLVFNFVSWKPFIARFIVLCIGLGIIYLPVNLTYKHWIKEYQLIGGAALDTFYAGEYNAKQILAGDVDGDGYIYMAKKYGFASDYKHSFLRFAIEHPKAIYDRLYVNIQNFKRIAHIFFSSHIFFYIFILLAAWPTSRRQLSFGFLVRMLLLSIALSGGSLIYMVFHIDARYMASTVIFFYIGCIYFGALFGELLVTVVKKLWPPDRKLSPAAPLTNIQKTNSFIYNIQKDLTSPIQFAGFKDSNPNALMITLILAISLFINIIPIDPKVFGQEVGVNKIKSLANTFREHSPAKPVAPSVEVTLPGEVSVDTNFIFAYYANTAIPFGYPSNNPYAMRRDLIYSFNGKSTDYTLYPDSLNDKQNPGTKGIIWQGQVPGVGDYVLKKISQDSNG